MRSSRTDGVSGRALRGCAPMQNRGPEPARSPRSGSVLLEFALISLVFYLLFAAIVTFGFLLYAAQGIQSTADFAAREIARTPLPAAIELNQVLGYDDYDNPQALATFRKQVFDKHYLVLVEDETGQWQGRPTIRDLVNDLPMVNQQLWPLMVADELGGRRVLRYPGVAVVDDDPTDNPDDPPSSGYLVEIPVVERIGGERRLRYAKPIEPVRMFDQDVNEYRDQFPITSRMRGLVALRINYPGVSAALTDVNRDPPGGFDPLIGNASPADLSDLDISPPVGTPVASDREYGPTAGATGLGRQAVLGEDVRPYYRLVTAQAIARREVFGN